jgi:predicted esterase
MTSKHTLQLLLILGLLLSWGFVSMPVRAADTRGSQKALQGLEQWLSVPREDRKPIKEQKFTGVALTKSDAAKAQQLLWQDHVTSLKSEAASEWEKKRIRIGKREMKFDYRIFGMKPKEGWSLYISLHGGGGAPKQVNDSQWRNQIRLYKPKEGIYLAPRAPTDTWNLWHQQHIDSLFDRLIASGIVHRGVNPNRVYVMGYSAGGDGVYQLAPRMADRWAAAAMMSGHPNDASPLGLRNIGFTIHAGEKDSAYNRNRVAAEWKQKLQTLRQEDPQGYAHEVHVHQGLGHWMKLKDAVAVDWMAGFTRNPLPEKVVWKQDDVTHDRFYWVAVPKGQAKKGAQVAVRRKGQEFEIVNASGVDTLILLLNDTMVNADKVITVRHKQKTLFAGTAKRTISTLQRTITERGDPGLVFSTEVSVDIAEDST